MNCSLCENEGWVCEAHPVTAWGNGRGCCGAAGIPCRCNPTATVQWDEVIAE